jgi:hydroxyethylthiazole kinase-like sugar kinase family protein
MATVPSEVTELSKIVGACLVNFGPFDPSDLPPPFSLLPVVARPADLTIPSVFMSDVGTIKDLDGMLAAGTAANRNGKPIVFDPVACGASELRKTSADGLSILLHHIEPIL